MCFLSFGISIFLMWGLTINATFLIVPLPLHLLYYVEVEQRVPPAMLEIERISLLLRMLRKTFFNLFGGQSRATKKFSTTFWSLPVLEKWQVIWNQSQPMPIGHPPIKAKYSASYLNFLNRWIFSRDWLIDARYIIFIILI